MIMMLAIMIPLMMIVVKCMYGDGKGNNDVVNHDPNDNDGNKNVRVC